MTSLAKQIDETRITYPEVEHGVRIEGSPFTIEFEDEVDPAEWVDDIATAEDPWRMFGVHNQLEEDYYSVASVLYEIGDDGITDATKVNIEVAPTFARVYVKGEEADEERVAQFVETVLDEYGGEVRFVDDVTNQEES